MSCCETIAPPKPGDVVELTDDMEGGWCNEPVRLVKKYKRKNSIWWMAESLITHKGFKGPTQYRFTQECIVEINGVDVCCNGF